MKKLVTFITATALLMNVNGPASFKVFASADKTIFINEIMAANTSTLRDGDTDDAVHGKEGGAYSDWIELYNAGEQAIDLTGYTLSDDGATWVFPEGVIPAKGYLVVWASDKNKVAADGQLHTNFKISSSGETITLKMPDKTVADTVTTVSLGDDQSYGRKNDGALEFMVFSEATPKASNIYTSATTAVKMPVFSHQGGFYESAFNLKISTDELKVKIYYTLDGSDPVPGVAGTYEYIGGIDIKSRAGEPNVLSMIENISADTVWNPWKEPNGTVFKCSIVKAVAIREDGVKSKIVTNTYFVDPNMKTRYSIPVISLVTDSDNLFDSTTGIYINTNCEKKGSEWERPMHIEFFEPDGSLGFSQYIGARLNGEWSRKFPQKSFRLYADGGYDDTDKFKYDVFSGLTKKVNGEKLDSFARLILSNGANDNSTLMLRDEVLQSLVSHLKIDTQAYRPSVVFLDGEYWGIYNIRERYDKKYLKAHYNLNKDKVAILDIWEEPVIQEGTAADVLAYTKDIIDYLKSNPITKQSTYEYIKTKMDIESFINTSIAQIYYDNTDWLYGNVTIWKYKTDDGQYHPEAPYGQDGRWRWLLRDTAMSFGIYDTTPDFDTLSFFLGDTTIPDLEYANEEWEIFLLKTLMKNTEFRNEFINRFADQINTSFEPQRVNQKIDEAKSAIEAAMPEHCDRWQNIQMTSTSPYKKSWSENVQVMKNFADGRPGYVRQHIVSNFTKYGVKGTASIKLNSDASQGYIKINSIDINNTTPGVINPSEWTGIYFKGVPLTIKAVPMKGFEFDHWEGVTAATGTSDTISLTPTGDMNIKAVYKEALNEVLVGDINDDKSINSIDFAVLRGYLLGIIKELPVSDENADLNGDGSVNSIDFALLRGYLLGFIKEF